MARIWILDAENLLLRLMARWLQHSGHTIVSCPSQESAQARAARIRNGEDLLIMDLSSVDTSGAGLMLKVLIPGLKFLFISEGPHARMEREEQRLISRASTGYSPCPSQALYRTRAFQEGRGSDRVSIGGNPAGE